MKIITVGGPTEVRQLVELYIEVNELDVDFGTGSQMLYEALQLAFSIKVLIRYVNCIILFYLYTLLGRKYGMSHSLTNYLSLCIYVIVMYTWK